jgi:hemerythrin
MGRFELTADMMTGVQDIDEQHRNIVALGNKVTDLSAIRTDKALFEDALRFLADYVIYHFAAEEFAMLAVCYPNYDHHRRWHEHFKEDITNYYGQAKAKEISPDLRLKISFAIENWLQEHIRITDQEFAKFLQQKGGSVLIRLLKARDLKDAGKLPEDINERLTKAASPDHPELAYL